MKLHKFYVEHHKFYYLTFQRKKQRFVDSMTDLIIFTNVQYDLYNIYIYIHIYIYIYIYTGCPQKFDVILNANILETTQCILMKLHKLYVEHHKFY